MFQNRMSKYDWHFIKRSLSLKMLIKKTALSHLQKLQVSKRIIRSTANVQQTVSQKFSFLDSQIFFRLSCPQDDIACPFSKTLHNYKGNCIMHHRVNEFMFFNICE